ncbi:Haloacid dehalogenase-like hydrolase (HAD) superfamily protein [Euphorbia peplus]|nr:Haloacid dehalogenase-like hydrolase (HAD) superfamily protein [Euphorbia peplus]
MDLMGQQEEVSVSKSVQLWRGIIHLLGFLLGLFLQIMRRMPCTAQMLLSYVGFRYPILSSSSSFKPLPVVEEVPLALIESSTPPRIAIPTDSLSTLLKNSLLPSSIRTLAIQAGLKWFELECISSDKVHEGRTKVNHVTVFERPGLREFLKHINEFADLVLFTAGVEGYARPLVDRIDAENRFSLRLYRPSTVSTQHREHVKDLSSLSNNLCRTVIVDNNPFSFLLQPSNGIPCVPFSAAQPYDNQLMDVILPLLKHLSSQKDVRPVLYERFHMPEWFQMHGIPVSR